MPPATAPICAALGPEWARAGLAAAREHTLELVAGLEDSELERVFSPLMSPLAWDLGHIGAYEDLWLVHRAGGRPLLRADLAEVYDAFETPRARRGEIDWLAPEAAREYLAEVRARALEVIEHDGVGDGSLHEMVIQHEHQHNETMLQTLELARIERQRPRRAPAPSPPPGAWTGLEYVEVPEGRFELGAPDSRFSYDNERPAHEVEVPAFQIGKVLVTNGVWLEWMRQGGYERPEWWSSAGWQARDRDDWRHPAGWIPDPDHELGFREWRMGGAEPLAPERPVAHVSWFEAQAFARAHGARLPTEAEWERAATFDPEAESKRDWPWGQDAGLNTEGGPRANLRETGLWGTAPAGAFPAGAAPCGALGMVGDLWEWTATEFDGYPGFRPHPYREYSEVFFARGYQVLRGGSWASSVRVATPTFRNWDFPQRRQIFSGVRLARDA